MKVSPRHWDILLNFIEANPEIITGKFTCSNAREKMARLWEEIAEALNSLGMGTKSAAKWKIALQDWKYKTKQKASAIRMSLTQTGGGPSNLKILNEQEERLMSFIGWKGVIGDDIEESGCPRKQSHFQSEIPKSDENKLPTEIQLSDENLLPTETPSVSSVGEEIIYIVPDTAPKVTQKGRKRTLSETGNYDRIDRYQTETMNVLKKIETNTYNISNELNIFNQHFSESINILTDILNTKLNNKIRL